MKTAVKILFEEMNRIRLEDECENIGAIEFFKLQNEAFEKAIAIERGQIVEAATWGSLSETGEIYYKEKYINDIGE